MIAIDRPVSVAFVDDDIYQLRTLKIMFERTGDFKVDVFDSANEALIKIPAGTYDCVVADYSMPLVNGAELVRRLKKLVDIPVVVFSGYVDKHVVDSVSEAGADEFVEKTVELEVFDRLGLLILDLVNGNHREPGDGKVLLPFLAETIIS